MCNVVFQRFWSHRIQQVSVEGFWFKSRYVGVVTFDGRVCNVRSVAITKDDVAKGIEIHKLTG